MLWVWCLLGQPFLRLQTSRRLVTSLTSKDRTVLYFRLRVACMYTLFICVGHVMTVVLSTWKRFQLKHCQTSMLIRFQPGCWWVARQLYCITKPHGSTIHAKVYCGGEREITRMPFVLSFFRKQGVSKRQP